jgi:hypothetical protein
VFGTQCALVGIGQLQQVKFLAVGPHELDADGESLITESGRHRERRGAAHGDEQHRLHPLVIGLHLPARNFLGPVLGDVEG